MDVRYKKNNMKINCTYNNTPIALKDEDALHRRLLAQATIADVIRRLWNVRDPSTGESVRITIIPNDDGVNIQIKGPQAVISEVDRMLGENPLE